MVELSTGRNPHQLLVGLHDTHVEQQALLHLPAHLRLPASGRCPAQLLHQHPPPHYDAQYDFTRCLRNEQFIPVVIKGRELGRLMPSVDNTRRRKADVQTAKSIWMLAVLYMVSWTPYAIVSLIGQFGLEDSITPVTATIPAFLAKTCILFDPLLYGFSHPQFRKSFKQMVGTPMSTNTITRGSSHTPPTSYAKRRVTRNFSSESSLRSQKPTPTLSVRRDIESKLFFFFTKWFGTILLLVSIPGRLSCNSRGTPSSIRKHTAEDNTDRLNSFKEGALGSFNVKDGVNPHHPSDSNPVGSRSLRVVNETDAITQSDVSGDSCHGARDVMCIVSSHHPLVVKSSLCTTNHDGQPV